MAKQIVLGLFVFLSLFWQLGKLTGKDEVLDLWNSLSIYIGSSILCFDHFTNSIVAYNNIGTNTFRGMYNILARFGLNVTTISNHLDKIRWNDYSSNVFTAFAPYYNDYGPVVSLIIVLIAGLLIGFFWRIYQTDNNNFITCILYGRFIAVSAAMYSIAERLFSNTIALNAIVEIFFYVCIIRVFVKKRSKIIRPVAPSLSLS